MPSSEDVHTGFDLPFLNRPLDSRRLAEMRSQLTCAIELTERRKQVLKIPQPIARLQKHPAMHYHFKPEIFLQLDGFTRFTTPREKIHLGEKEILIMPAGVPHKEFAQSAGRKPFRNLVVGFYSNTLSFHFACEVSPGTPDIEVIEFFDAPNIHHFISLTGELIRVVNGNSPMKTTIIRGFLVALLGMLLSHLHTSGSSLNSDIGKVFQTKWLVRDQLANPELNVKTIAEKLQCSPDYLSHLFRTKTNEKLVHYIQRMRIIGAIQALETTNLYVSEIAWSCGFQDPAYFARVFRKFTGCSPQDYRDKIEKKQTEPESLPKTIYYDREDYSHGEPLPQNRLKA